jgi:hypothetical protein
MKFKVMDKFCNLTKYHHATLLPLEEILQHEVQWLIYVPPDVIYKYRLYFFGSVREVEE